jgi:hypothetical protein
MVLEKLIVPQLPIFPAFLRTWTSIMVLRNPPPCHYSVPDSSSLHSPILHLDYLFNIFLQFVHKSSRGLFQVSVPKPLYTSISLHSLSCYIPRLFHSPWFYHPNVIGWGLQMVKLFITQFSPVSLHFLRLGLKYLLEHPSLEHPHVMFLPQCDRSSFTPIHKQTTLQFCIYKYLCP